MQSWFSRLVGFDESVGPDEVRRRLRVVDGALVSDHSPDRPRVGRTELVSLRELRSRLPHSDATSSTVRTTVGDVSLLHRDPANAGALFQAASQFNLLEMISPDVTPDDGVAGYEHDHTQGPACAVAVGAATIWRNYLMPVDGGIGQTRDRQIDAVADLGAALSEGTALPLPRLWEMRNGYALCHPEGLTAIAAHLGDLDEAGRDRLRSLLRIGVVWEAEVTGTGHLVSQAYCSALPVAYSPDPAHPGWAPLARLVLEATYEATLLAARLNPASDTVFLTGVGGGVFGNDPRWIRDAIDRALALVPGLDVVVVGHAAVPGWARGLATGLP